jgi:hypothetical protein
MEGAGQTGISRRSLIKAGLIGTGYTVPAIVSAIAVTREVTAVSSAPGQGMVTFTLLSGSYRAEGAGFPAGLPFLLVIVNTDQSITTSYVATDATGNFVARPDTASFPLGSTPAPGIVNGGNIFVQVANTFGGVQPTTPTATRPAGTQPVVPTVGGPTPTATTGRGGPPTIPPATQTAAAQTQTAVARRP